MEALPNIPMDMSSGGLTEEARVIENDFGDGYRQRAGDGINPIGSTFEAKWDNITTAEANTLVAFFRARGGYEAFTFTPPNESGTWAWTCKSWSRPPDNAGYASLSATFRREFDLS